LASIVENNLLCLKELIFNNNKSVFKDIAQREETINYVNKKFKICSFDNIIKSSRKGTQMVPQILINFISVRENLVI